METCMYGYATSGPVQYVPETDEWRIGANDIDASAFVADTKWSNNDSWKMKEK